MSDHIRLSGMRATRLSPPAQEAAPEQTFAHPAHKHCEDQENNNTNAAHVDGDPIVVGYGASQRPI